MSAQAQQQICLLQLDGMTLSSRFEARYLLRLGGSAEVWLARNVSPKPGEPAGVVIKALNVRRDGEPGAELEQLLIEGFEREANALRQCSHDNIVKLLDCGVAIDNAGRTFQYLVLEYLSGGSLRELFRGKRLKLSEALVLLGQVKDALSCLHRHGLIHRDLKPLNVMLSADRKTATLIDLGTIRSVSDHSQVTQIGTPTYAAPEHSITARQEKALTPATDVYAFAKTAYSVITGEEPFDFKYLQLTSLPSTVANESWAKPVLRVLTRATDEKPQRRQQSVAEFYADLCEATEVTTYTIGSSCDTDRQPGRSRIEVDVQPLPREPSTLEVVLTQLWRGVLWLGPLLWHLLVRTFDGLFRRSGTLRAVPVKLYVIVLAVILFCSATLVLGPSVFRLARSLMSQRQVIVDTPPSYPEGSLRATTDINIRETPNPRARRIGLVEKDSVVRLLSKNQNERWCEIEILSHGRPKADASFVDRGWVSCRYLAGDSR